MAAISLFGDTNMAAVTSCKIQEYTDFSPGEATYPVSIMLSGLHSQLPKPEAYMGGVASGAGGGGGGGLSYSRLRELVLEVSMKCLRPTYA